MTTINPCPFCGHDDVEIDEVDLHRFAVTCPECECIGPVFGAVMDAINAWNGSVLRTPPAAIRDPQFAIAFDLENAS